MSSTVTTYNAAVSRRVGDDLILERMYAREQVLLSQADALDMKASYLLVVLVFLAQLSTTFLSTPNLPCLAKVSQWLSCLLLIASGVFLLLELRIKPFSNEDAAGLEAWRDRVIRDSLEPSEIKETPPSDDYLRSRLIWGLIASSKARILESEKINEKKVRPLKLAYWFASAAFLLDILFVTKITAQLF